MSPSVFIFGANGFLGSKFKDYFSQKKWTVITNRVDARDYSGLHQILSLYRPNIVLNAAGYTGYPNVDGCEDNIGKTLSINIGAAINIASSCHELGLSMIHLGSGCIYDGPNMFTEEDTPNFTGSLYSRAKAQAESMLSEFPNVLQLRIRIPIVGHSHPKNVIDKLKKYDKIISVENSFTIVEDLLPATYELITKKQTGIFNMTNVGSMDHAYLMDQYKTIVDPSFTYTVMSLDEMHSLTKAKRSNTTLNTDKREQLGVHMPEIKERIKEILQNYKDSLAS